MIKAGQGRGVCSATWIGHDENGNPFEAELGCSNNLPLDAFRDQKPNTICDMCLYNKGFDIERIITRLDYIFSVYPKNKWNQRFYEERASKAVKYWEEWTDAIIRIIERGEKPTARRLATEAGVSVGLIYKVFKRKPMQVLERAARRKMEVAGG